MHACFSACQQTRVVLEAECAASLHRAAQQRQQNESIRHPQMDAIHENFRELYRAETKALEDEKTKYARELAEMRTMRDQLRALRDDRKALIKRP
jgi:uncharacterized protein involved in exopolysaccharide biosynthesis